MSKESEDYLTDPIRINNKITEILEYHEGFKDIPLFNKHQNIRGNIWKLIQSYADEQNTIEVDTILKLKAKLKEVEEEKLFLSKRFTKEKRKANNAIDKLNKLKGFSEVEDSCDSFSGSSYINIRYTNKTALEIQSIRNMILDLNQQDNAG